MTILAIYLATPRSLGPDAWRELCWTASLPPTVDGYGVLHGLDSDLTPATWFIADVPYVQLLIDSHTVGVGGIEIPTDKICVEVEGWVSLRCDPVWGRRP